LTNIIAGIIGGSEQGVAKNVHLVDVRVMDNTGRGYVDDIMAGLNYVVGKHSTCILHMIRMS
jgi:subtilisin family serine protease